MKQGKDFVYVKVTLALLPQLFEWSKPVQVRVEEDLHTGDILMIFRDGSPQGAWVFPDD